jgi:BMFP domain-containing protein YqiC
MVHRSTEGVSLSELVPVETAKAALHDLYNSIEQGQDPEKNGTGSRVHTTTRHMANSVFSLLDVVVQEERKEASNLN